MSRLQDTRICFVGESFVNGTSDRTFLGWTGRICAAAAQNDRYAITDLQLAFDEKPVQNSRSGCKQTLIIG